MALELELNLPNEGERYREFYGQNINQMPHLLKASREPLSTVDLMQRRLAVRDPSFSKEVTDSWWANYFDTGDGILYHPNGKVKVVLGAEFLRKLTPRTPLVNRAVKLGNDRDSSIEIYNQTEGPEFTRSEVKNDKFSTVWLTLAGDDRALLDEYKQAVREEFKARHNYEGSFMDIYVASAQNVITGRLWRVYRSYSNSNAGGDSSLDNLDDRLVGVAPEAQLEETLVRSASPEVRSVLQGPSLIEAVETIYSHLSGLSGTDIVTKKGLHEALAPHYKK